MELVDYTIAVLEHLMEAKWRGSIPNGYDMAAARDSGVSPSKFAAFWMRRHASS